MTSFFISTTQRKCISHHKTPLVTTHLIHLFNTYTHTFTQTQMDKQYEDRRQPVVATHPQQPLHPEGEARDDVDDTEKVRRKCYTIKSILYLMFLLVLLTL